MEPKGLWKAPRNSLKYLIQQYFLPVTRSYIRASYLTFFGSTGWGQIPKLTTTVTGISRKKSEYPLTRTAARNGFAPNKASSSLLTMSLRSGTLAFVSLVFASACACTVAYANGGFRPVSEEFRGAARAPEDASMRSNSIRSDVSRYNAERATPRATGGGDPARAPQMRGGYRSN
jgi:hypothetical protein